ncbi:MAG: hypothetical protein Q8S15_00210, partial [Erysipelotrichaceae bacterium]|nr:hypothetical protein [Erysipelotrichaceae bacterium]
SRVSQSTKLRLAVLRCPKHEKDGITAPSTVLFFLLKPQEFHPFTPTASSTLFIFEVLKSAPC